jgi:hypothetical protein
VTPALRTWARAVGLRLLLLWRSVADVGADLVELGRALVGWRRAGASGIGPAPVPAAVTVVHQIDPPPRRPPDMITFTTGDQTNDIAAALIEQLEHRRVELDAVLWPIARLGRVADPLWPPLHRTEDPSS